MTWNRAPVTELMNCDPRTSMGCTAEARWTEKPSTRDRRSWSIDWVSKAIWPCYCAVKPHTDAGANMMTASSNYAETIVEQRQSQFLGSKDDFEEIGCRNEGQC